MTTVPTDTTGLLLDTNVLVLFAVGTVNRRRIESFKRTNQYTIEDFDLLLRVIAQWESLFTVPHVLAEVSNLTNLTGPERPKVRQILKATISVLTEVSIPSARATLDPTYPGLGLVDAAIASVAREYRCTVLTDDLDLYLWLAKDGVDVLNFTHLRVHAQGL
jgi:predicted nucleic acid-binding protein